MLGENGNMALSWWENMLQDSNSECASNVKEDARQQQKGTLHILMVRIWHKQYENTVQTWCCREYFLGTPVPEIGFMLLCEIYVTGT